MVMAMAMRVGLIRVLTTHDEAVLKRHGQLLEQIFPGLSVESRCIEEQFEGVHDDVTEALAVPKVVALGRELVSAGVDGLYVSCAGDPGVAQLQSQVSVPVIGAGVAVASLARSFRRPLGVLGITEKPPGPMQQVLGEQLIGTICPDGVKTTLDFLSLDAEARFIEAGQRLVSKGAWGLILACTGLSAIEMAPRLRSALNVPVFDPLFAAGATLSVALGVY